MLVLSGVFIAACAGISPRRSVVKQACQFAKGQGTDTKGYSATVLERPDEYFVHFTRRRLFRKIGDDFAVSVDKATGKQTLTHGQ